MSVKLWQLGWWEQMLGELLWNIWAACCFLLWAIGAYTQVHTLSSSLASTFSHLIRDLKIRDHYKGRLPSRGVSLSLFSLSLRRQSSLSRWGVMTVGMHWCIISISGDRLGKQLRLQVFVGWQFLIFFFPTWFWYFRCSKLACISESSVPYVHCKTLKSLFDQKLQGVMAVKL